MTYTLEQLENNIYTYEVQYLNLYDGDTFEIVPDLGFGISFNMPGESNWRLRGWDTPELRSASAFEKSEGNRAKRFVDDWFKTQATVYMRSYKYEETDSLNRWLAEIWGVDADGNVTQLGKELYDLQLATEWPTRWREVHDPTT